MFSIALLPPRLSLVYFGRALGCLFAGGIDPGDHELLCKRCPAPSLSSFLGKDFWGWGAPAAAHASALGRAGLWSPALERERGGGENHPKKEKEEMFV